MPGNFAHILVPTDFGPASDTALACAREIAKRFDARLSLLHVVTDPRAAGIWTTEVYVPTSLETREGFLREARQRLDTALTADGRGRGGVTVAARIGQAGDGISEFAREQNVDLIVMGTHARTGLAHLFLGSVAERVLRSAPCPVLTTHAVYAQAVSEKVEALDVPVA